MSEIVNAVNSQVENVDVFSNDYKLENRTITNVMVSKETGRNGRVVITLSGESFPSLTPQEEKVMTNNVSFDITQIMTQFGSFSPYIRIANSYIGGVGAIPTPIISMALIGGVVSLNRLYKKKGEKRENGEDIYSSNIFKSVVTNFVANVDEVSTQMLSFELKNLSEKANKASANLVEEKKVEPGKSKLGLTLIW